MDAPANDTPPASRQPAFIVGTSRGGTTWLSRVLNTHPDICSFGESMYWGRSYLEPASPQGYNREQVEHLASARTNGRWGPHGHKPGSLSGLNEDGFGGPLIDAVRTAMLDAPTPITPHDLFQIIADAACQSEGKSLAVEKTPHHINWHERITAGYPAAKFIVMLRTPYEFMRSYKHQGGQISDKAREDFKKGYHPIACALVWRGFIRSAASLKANPNARSLEVWTHELKTSETAILNQIQQLLGVTPTDLTNNVPPDNSSFEGNPAPELDPADIFWMNRLAGREIRKHGLDLRRTPFAPLAITASILRIPFWAFRTLRQLRTRTSGSLLAYLYRWIR
ncbi:sulfotransferase [Mucisphaera sp.]|uniref:sulfotransferase n=1 Tax=Mucisphaera sp. TaxID=2913024 RepID=UPI003D11C812